MENKIIEGDCIEELKKLEDGSVDAIITDPPYGLEFMGKNWDKFKEGKNIAGGNTGKDTPYARSKPTPAFYQLTNSDMVNFQKFTYEWANECLRVLKSGGYLLSFGGTRTYHRLACAIEDAGFEIRDCIMWIYGSGFPKSMNISKAIDKMYGEKRKGIIRKDGMATRPQVLEFADRPIKTEYEDGLPITDEAKEWDGWGTALKPACEPIVVARKPMSEKSTTLNVLKYKVGGLNIDACRIEHNEEIKTTKREERKSETWKEGSGFKNENVNLASANPQGRFPANVILDEEAGRLLDIQSGITLSKGGQSFSKTSDIYGKYSNDRTMKGCGFNDKGGASRFFYCPKASKSERNFGLEEFESKPIAEINKLGGSKNTMLTGSGNERSKLYKNNHPTVKPISLIEYLIKLVTREGQTILDPFLGSGTTAIACLKLNREFIGIEKEPEYVKIAKARIKPFSLQKKL